MPNGVSVVVVFFFVFFMNFFFLGGGDSEKFKNYNYTFSPADKWYILMEPGNKVQTFFLD